MSLMSPSTRSGPSRSNEIAVTIPILNAKQTTDPQFDGQACLVSGCPPGAPRNQRAGIYPSEPWAQGTWVVLDAGAARRGSGSCIAVVVAAAAQ